MRRIFNLVKHPLFSGSMIMVIGSNSVSFLNYIYHFIMGRLLGPANYGELASIISLIGLLGILPGSITLVITKEVSSAKKEKEKITLIRWFKKKILLISLSYMLILLVLSPFLGSFLKLSNFSYIILIAISFFFSLQSSLNRSILQGLLKFKEMVISILVENSTRLLASIILLFLGFQVGGVMLAFVISAIAGLYMTIVYLKLKVEPAGNVKLAPNIKSMSAFALPVAVQFLAITSLYSSDVILVKHFFSTHDAGIYAALSTLGKIIFFGAGPIGSVMFPLISQRKALGQDYKRIFIYSFYATALLAASILMIYWIFPQTAIQLLYGKLFVESAYLLVWFGIFITLFTFAALLVNYHLSLGNTSVVVLPLIAALVQIILIWFLHQSLFNVILISIIITALLLTSLLIYSYLWKTESSLRQK